MEVKNKQLWKKSIDVILLAGGKGSRFRPVNHNRLYKSLYKVNDSVLLQYSTDLLDFDFINSLIFAIDDNSKGVIDWVKTQNFPCEVFFSTQEEPGVLGAVKGAQRYVTADNFLVCNTDEIRDGLSMGDLVKTHINEDNTATLAATYADKLYFHRVLTLEKDGSVSAMELREQTYREHPEYIKKIHIGFMILNKKALKYFDFKYGKDWDGMLGPLVQNRLIKAKVNVGVSFFNVGTPEELKEAKRYFAAKRRESIKRKLLVFNGFF